MDFAIASSVQKIWQLCYIEKIYLLVELHQEGSATNLATPSSFLGPRYTNQVLEYCNPIPQHQLWSLAPPPPCTNAGQNRQLD